jgi:hypothetical protein
MELTLVRDTFTPKSTTGRLLVNGTFDCYTLEDTVRKGPKIPGKTAIPAGRYKVIITHSNRFKKNLPLLVNVPGFEGIRIHPGNCDADTEGCILVGFNRAQDWVGASRLAFNDLFLKINEAQVPTEGCWITIREERAA